MAEIPHWNDQDEQAVRETQGSWDVCYLGGSDLPGIARVDVEYPCGIDRQKPRGKRAAKLRDVGDEPMRIKIRLQITTRNELVALGDTITLLNPRAKGSSRNPLEIIHPNANAWGITVVVLGNIKSSQPTAKDGWIIEIEAFEWNAELQAAQTQSTKPKGTGDDASAWAPFVDDDVAGPGVPSNSDAATKHLGL